MNKGVDCLVRGPAEVFGLGIVQLEEQEKRVLTGKFPPKKEGIALNDGRYMGDVGHEVAEVLAPICRRNLAKRRWKETNEFLESGVHQSVLVDELEEIKPIMEAMFVDVHPQVVRSGRANVEPKRCGPNMLLRTRVEANLDNVAHQV